MAAAAHSIVPMSDAAVATPAPATPRVSKSARAGLVLPVARLVRVAKENDGLGSISSSGATVLAATLETILTDVIQRACAIRGDDAKKQQQRVTAYHIKRAIHTDENLAALFAEGVVMNTYHVDEMEVIDPQ